MSDINIAIDSGTSKRLLTGGKYCEKDIIVTATGGADDYQKHFWDLLQDYGNEGYYHSRFQNHWWTAKTFTPEYDIKSDNMSYTFRGWQNTSDGLLDMTTLKGKIDFSICGTAEMTFEGNTVICRLGKVDLTMITWGWAFFEGMANLQTIDEFCVPTDKAFMLDDLKLGTCPNLTEVRFSGKIYNTLTLQSCDKLSVESAVSALLHLEDYSTTEEAFTQTIYFNAAVWEKLATSGIAPPIGDSWDEYVVIKGWLS